MKVRKKIKKPLLPPNTLQLLTALETTHELFVTLETTLLQYQSNHCFLAYPNEIYHDICLQTETIFIFRRIVQEKVT